jgi:hypothetical protein
MRILVTEAQQGDGRLVGALLATAGHEVAFCHPPGLPAESCAGLVPGRRCPLLGQRVDVVLDVRLEAGALSLREMGALCAVHSGTPVVLVDSDLTDSPLQDLLTGSRPDKQEVLRRP